MTIRAIRILLLAGADFGDGDQNGVSYIERDREKETFNGTIYNKRN